MKSIIEKERQKYVPKIPPSLRSLNCLVPEPREKLPLDSNVEPLFPHLKELRLIEFQASNEGFARHLTLGIVFSGGPASGGHNVAAGVYDAMLQFDVSSKLIGFLGGPSGIINNSFIVLDKEKIDEVRNQGGFSLLSSGRTKIETQEQFFQCKTTCESQKLDGLIIVGGDDSNTNAALLAEYFLQTGCKTAVVGVPKTIDGDLKNQWVETSFGFDSASKTYSEIIGNIEADAASQGKYYFFIKIMGRTASHLLLECALQTRPNFAIISEEAKANAWTLEFIIDQIANLIIDRAAQGKNHGVVLIPEGLIEFVPEFKKLIEGSNEKIETLPENIQAQFFLEKDPHGNIQVSKIETEKLLIALVSKALSKKNYSGNFSAQPLFLGYEGRSCLPSNFDCDYCYSLGLSATLLIAHNKTGMMAIIKQLNQSTENWVCCGVPLAAMLKLTLKNGKQKPVIEQHLVDLNGPLYKRFESNRELWKLKDHYTNPGPIQFFGPSEIKDKITLTLMGEEE